MRILYITHHFNNKIKGTYEKRNRNAISFLRLFLIIINSLSYVKNDIRMVKFSDILNLIDKHSQFTLIAILVFPLVLPIPYPPGLPTILAIPMFIFIINGLCGKKFIKIPKRINNIEIKVEMIKNIVMKSKIIIPILAKISRGGRMSFLASNQMAKLHIFFMFLLCFIILMPFPGSNYLPSISIFVISLGVVLTDGILILIGYLIGIVGVFLVALFLIFGKKIVLTFIHFIQYLPF